MVKPKIFCKYSLIFSLLSSLNTQDKEKRKGKRERISEKHIAERAAVEMETEKKREKRAAVEMETEKKREKRAARRGRHCGVRFSRA